MFKNIDEIKEFNKNTGHYFFDKDTMRSFSSRISNKVYDGRFFITSEKSKYQKTRYYSVREIDKDGGILTLYHGLSTRYKAISFVKKHIKLMLLE